MKLMILGFEMPLVPDVANNKMMISKIYLRDSARGMGIGSKLLNFIENECSKRTLNKLWLTVNHFNAGPIEWYKQKGFEIIDEVKKDIGGSFFMDDYIMEKQLQAHTRGDCPSCTANTE